MQLQNYVTSINVMALVAAKQDDKYKAIIGDAVAFLKKLQWDEEEGKRPKRRLLRRGRLRQQIAPRSVQHADVPRRPQGRRRRPRRPGLEEGAHLRQPLPEPQGREQRSPWAKLINDGSFIYTPATGGVTKVVDKPLPDGVLPGYGSMTYAGIKSMIYCGVTKDDPRIKKAYEWIQHNYTVDKNPGMPEAALAVGPVLLLQHDGQVPRHARHRLRRRCQGSQARLAQGHHRSTRQASTLRRQLEQYSANWMEADANLDTGYALMALSYCKPK